MHRTLFTLLAWGGLRARSNGVRRRAKATFRARSNGGERRLLTTHGSRKHLFLRVLLLFRPRSNGPRKPTRPCQGLARSLHTHRGKWLFLHACLWSARVAATPCFLGHRAFRARNNGVWPAFITRRVRVVTGKRKWARVSEVCRDSAGAA